MDSHSVKAGAGSSPGRGRSSLQLKVLYEVSKITAGTHDSARSILEIFNVLAERLGAKRALLGMRNRETGKVEVISSLGHPPKATRSPHYRWAVELIKGVDRSGYPQLIDDVAAQLPHDDLSDDNDDGTWAVCVPVRVRGRTIGALMIETPHALQAMGFEDEVNFLKIVASMLGHSLELHKKVVGSGRRSGAASSQADDEGPTLIGTSHEMREILKSIEQIGPGQATVLIRGESGTGKELVAQAIHRASPRRSGPFVKVVTVALPETLLETALFGHERGAFTGATERKAGFLEEANGGTLFLDEIGDISHGTQLKLLRFLQEKTFERVGGTRPIAVDVRVITATNCDLEAAVRSGQFREDLYYRLNVVPLVLSPLRERSQDIPELVEHFVKEFSRHYHKEIDFSGDAMRKLQDYDWPGNVRELENFVERLMVLAPDSLIAAKDIVLPKSQVKREKDTVPVELVAEPVSPSRMTLKEMERDEVVRALEECGGVQKKAAKLLGITPRQLAYRIKKFGIAQASIQYQ